MIDPMISPRTRYNNLATHTRSIDR
jgi:hypothetical protein